MKGDWHGVPSRRLLRLAGVGVVLGLLTFFMAGMGALLLLWWVGLLAVAAADRFLLKPQPLTLELEMPAVLVLGKETEVAWVFGQASGPSLEGFIHLQCPEDWEAPRLLEAVQLQADGETRLPVQVRALKRGAFTYGKASLAVTGGLRLWTYLLEIDAACTAKVMPDYRIGNAHLIGDRRHGDMGLRRTRQRGEGTDFESLREYRPGDEIARIDWKATSRFGKAISRQYAVEKDHDILIALDCGRLMGARFDGIPKHEHALRSTLALTEAATRNGDRVGLLAFSQDIKRHVAPAKGDLQVGLVLDAVHDLESDLSETDFPRALAYLGSHHRKRSLVVVFTDFLDRQTAGPMLAALDGIARKHVCLFVAVEDPTLEDRLAEEPLGVEGLGGQAIAYGMQKERGEVLAILKRQGVEVLNLRPDHVHAEVLNAYFELRNSGRL